MDEIEIPNNALVHCPKQQFNLVRMAGCVGCVSFDGLADRYPDSNIKFTQRYLVKCRFEPVKREIKELVE